MRIHTGEKTVHVWSMWEEFTTKRTSYRAYEDPHLERNCIHVISAGRVHTKGHLQGIWEFILERNRSLVINVGRVSNNQHTLRNIWTSTLERNYTQWSMRQKYFESFRPEETPESSYKGEATFMSFVWKEFFMFRNAKKTSENAYWCERSCVLECGRTFTLAEHLKTALENSHWRKNPYKCSHCDKRSVLQETWNTREDPHWREKPYHCTACGSVSNVHLLYTVIQKTSTVSRSSSDPALSGLIAASSPHETQ